MAFHLAEILVSLMFAAPMGAAPSTPDPDPWSSRCAVETRCEPSLSSSACEKLKTVVPVAYRTRARIYSAKQMETANLCSFFLIPPVVTFEISDRSIELEAPLSAATASELDLPKLELLWNPVDGEYVVQQPSERQSLTLLNGVVMQAFARAISQPAIASGATRLATDFRMGLTLIGKNGASVRLRVSQGSFASIEWVRLKGRTIFRRDQAFAEAFKKLLSSAVVPNAELTRSPGGKQPTSQPSLGHKK